MLAEQGLEKIAPNAAATAHAQLSPIASAHQLEAKRLVHPISQKILRKLTLSLNDRPADFRDIELSWG